MVLMKDDYNSCVYKEPACFCKFCCISCIVHWLFRAHCGYDLTIGACTWNIFRNRNKRRGLWTHGSFSCEISWSLSLQSILSIHCKSLLPLFSSQRHEKFVGADEGYFAFWRSCCKCRKWILERHFHFYVSWQCVSPSFSWQKKNLGIGCMYNIFFHRALEVLAHL